MTTYANLLNDVRAKFEVDSDDLPESVIQGWIRVAERNLWRVIRHRVNRQSRTLPPLEDDGYNYSIDVDVITINAIKINGRDHVRKSLDFVDRAIKQGRTAGKYCWSMSEDGHVRATSYNGDAIAIAFVTLPSIIGAADDSDQVKSLVIVYDALLNFVLAEGADHYDYPDREERWLTKAGAIVTSINDTETGVLV